MSLRPRFSLRTLLLLMLTIAGGIGVWWRWEPWVEIRSIKLGAGLTGGKRYQIPWAEFAMNGQRIVTRNPAGVVEVWDSTGASRKSPQWGQQTWRGISLTPDRSVLYSTSNRSVASPDGAVQTLRIIHLWDLKSETDRSVAEALPAFTTHSFTPDNRGVVIGCADGSVHVRSTKDGSESLTFKGHEAAINSVACSNDGRFIVTCGEDGVARIWNAKTGAHLRVLTGYTESVFRCFFTPDSQRLITYTYDDNSSRLWDPETGEVVAKFPGGPAHRIEEAITADSQKLLTTHYITYMRDAHNGDLTATFRNSHGDSKVVLGDHLSPCGTRALCVSHPGLMRLFNTMTGELVKELEHDSTIPSPWCHSFSSKRIATNTVENSCRISSLENGETLYLLKHKSPLTAVQLRADDSLCVTCTNDDQLHVWQRRRGEEGFGFDFPVEVWLTFVLVLVLVWSVIDNWGTLKSST